jgi:hypothetical protein
MKNYTIEDEDSPEDTTVPERLSAVLENARKNERARIARHYLEDKKLEHELHLDSDY